MDFTKLVGLDFETYCALPLPEVGLARYVNDPTFMPTLASVSTWANTTTIEFPAQDPDRLRAMLAGDTIVCAHNAGFERAVLKTMGIDIPVIDSAVVAAMAGADRHLAGAARQLLNMDKLDEDRSLLRLFALPQKDQPGLEFDMTLPSQHPVEWYKFREYCERDAELSRKLIMEWHGSEHLFEREMRFAKITLDMNEAGWPVDIEAVREMRERYQANLDEIQKDFAAHIDADLNIFSHPQVKEWCADRGVRSSSFDKQNVERLIAKLEKHATRQPLTKGQAQVLELLRVKQELGGSSLKKLDTILATAYNGRVYDQYVHAGAPQSLRTSGRSIQMQNLPRLGWIRDMEQLHMEDSYWSNEELSENLRQVFRSSSPYGQLIVADFASIESRGLAYLAGEQWKLDAYRRGEDVYKAQAVKIFKLGSVDDVDKSQRTTGKVGELSCGYGAGPVAVKDFAAKMHVEMSEAQAGKLVRDWRDANPKIVDLWERLGTALFEAVKSGVPQTVVAAHGISIKFHPSRTPESLHDQDPSAQSFQMIVWKGGTVIMSRVFHGCYLRGRNIGYYKPSSLKGGKPWKNKYVDPKTKRPRFYELYGGKLAGILTQSLCREIFFDSLTHISKRLEAVPNVTIVGQFHDEVVVDWVPAQGQPSLAGVMAILEGSMNHSLTHPELPMGVEVKHAYRYIK